MRHSPSSFVLLLACLGCSAGPAKTSTASYLPSADTVVTRRGPGNLEATLVLSPRPRFVGDVMQVRIWVRNIGSDSVPVTVHPCGLVLAGMPRTPARRDSEVVCQVSSSSFALAPKKSWEQQDSIQVPDRPGRYPLKVLVTLQPDIWLGVDLELRTP